MYVIETVKAFGGECPSLISRYIDMLTSYTETMQNSVGYHLCPKTYWLGVKISKCQHLSPSIALVLVKGQSKSKF